VGRNELYRFLIWFKSLDRTPLRQQRTSGDAGEGDLRSRAGGVDRTILGQAGAPA
jgi:hypothetical protein